MHGKRTYKKTIYSYNIYITIHLGLSYIMYNYKRNIHVICSTCLFCSTIYFAGLWILDPQSPHTLIESISNIDIIIKYSENEYNFIPIFLC